jgi:hypothetical protein
MARLVGLVLVACILLDGILYGTFLASIIFAILGYVTYAVAFATIERRFKTAALVKSDELAGRIDALQHCLDSDEERRTSVYSRYTAELIAEFNLIPGATSAELTRIVPSTLKVRIEDLSRQRSSLAMLSQRQMWLMQLSSGLLGWAAFLWPYTLLAVIACGVWDMVSRRRNLPSLLQMAWSAIKWSVLRLKYTWWRLVDYCERRQDATAHS